MKPIRRAGMVCLLVSVVSSLCFCALPQDVLFPGTWKGEIARKGLKEPSGIVYHPVRKTLFVVSDEGDLYEIQTDGKLLAHKAPKKWRDLEGITFDPSTGLLYVAVEGEERILEVDPADLTVLREFTIPRSFQGKTVMAKGGQGIEGVAFVPDAKHPEGGTFFVCNQCFSWDNKTDVSAIFELEVPLRSGKGGGEARILRQISLGILDLADLCYDAAGDQLLVVSDATNSFWRIRRDGTILAGCAFPGQDQEGIAVDPENNLYIAQDSGGIVQLKWLRPKRSEK
jgi:uncharacterized protein YjiK